MAPKKAKSKNKGTQNDSQSQEEEPDLTSLSQEIEKRAKKSKKTRETSTDEATDTGTLPEPSTSVVLSAPESLPKDLIQEMRFEIENMKRQNRFESRKLYTRSSRNQIVSN